MRIITGDECGIIKEVIPEYTRKSRDNQLSGGIKRIAAVDHEQQTRYKGVVSLAFLPTKSSDGSSNDDGDDGILDFASLRIDGSVELWTSNKIIHTNRGAHAVGGSSMLPLNYKRSKLLPNVFSEEKHNTEDGSYAKPLTMCAIRNKLTCCDSSGKISVISYSENSDPSIVAHYHVNAKLGKAKTYADKSTNSVGNSDLYSSFTLSQSGRAAIGGKQRETMIFDVETGKQIWKAKNLPPDPQTLLQEPIWTTAIQFLSNDSVPSTIQKNNNTNANVFDDLLLVGTAYRQIKLYDIRSQRRPIILMKEGVFEQRITALCQVNQNHAVVGDTAGYMHMIDLRKMDKAVGRYNGPAGSIRQIVRHSSLPVLACVGLDRMLRTYDINTRKEIDIIYLKQRLNCSLFCLDGEFEMNRQNNHKDQDNHNPSNLAENGDIDEDDEVKDYVDSDDNESKEIENDDEISSSSGEDSTPDELEFSNSEEDQSAEDDEEEIINSKKKRKIR